MIRARAAGEQGFEPPLHPSDAVELTRATLPAPAAMLIAGTETRSGARAIPFDPPASCTRKYWPGLRDTFGSSVIWFVTPKLPVPVALAYCSDLPLSDTGDAPRLKI